MATRMIDDGPPRVTGFHWHVHHEELVEWCYDYEARERYIRTRKPEHERETRLRVFRPVTLTKLPARLLKAIAAYEKVVVRYDKADEAYDRAATAYSSTLEVSRAWLTLQNAEEAYDKARDRLGRATETIDWDALHREDCLPDCPWDGRTIFPVGAKA